MSEPRELSPIKEIPVKIGGEVRPLRLDAMALMRFEEEAGITWFQFLKKLGEAFSGDTVDMEELPPVRHIVAALWAGFVHADAELSIEDVAQAVTLKINEFAALVMEANQVQGQQPEEEGRAPGNELKAVEKPSESGISTASASSSAG